MSDKEPFTMDRYIAQVVDNKLKELHTCMPGKIVSFDTDTQIAEIQPLIRRIFVNSGPVDLPLCISCPVMFPRAGGFSMTFPVTVGDECMIMFSERALDTWLQSGGVQLPLDTRRHSLSDAIAILGLYSQPNKLESFFTTGIEIKADDGSIYFRLDGTGITIKGNVNIDGNITMTGTSTATDHTSDTISGKTHTHPGDSGGTTGPPNP